MKPSGSSGVPKGKEGTEGLGGLLIGQILCKYFHLLAECQILSKFGLNPNCH